MCGKIIDAYILHGCAYINISFRHLSRATFPLFVALVYAPTRRMRNALVCLTLSLKSRNFERIKNALKTQTQKHFLCAFLFLLYTCSVCSSFFIFISE